MSDPVLPFERPLGARPTGDATTEFRVWAPRAERVVLRAGGGDHELADAGHGVREAVLPGRAGRGLRVRDRGRRAARSGLALAARRPARALARARPGRVRLDRRGLHAARPRRQRDLRAARRHVHARGDVRRRHPAPARLRELGITTIELLPVAEFPGAHGWGYDGVYLSAAHSAYGGPLGLQRLVDAAHAEGLAVLLDVVYNHVGASGAQALEAFGPYFTDDVRDVLGQGDELRRRRLRRRARVGAAERRGLDPRLPLRRAAARRHPRDPRRRRRPPRAGAVRARARARARARW